MVLENLKNFTHEKEGIKIMKNDNEGFSDNGLCKLLQLKSKITIGSIGPARIYSYPDIELINKKLSEITYDAGIIDGNIFIFINIEGKKIALKPFPDVKTYN